MYSLVLMAALTTPATTLDCHKTRCSGCTGSNYASCTGGCYGSSCSGSRCSGSCYGSRSSGCYGSCSGSSYSNCSGCTGSSCSGSAYYYTGSCWGGHSCYGCSGSSGAACYGNSTSNYPPSYDYQPAPKTEMPKPTTFNTSSPAPAVVSITLPADAKLYVDGQLTKTMDKAFRTFATPELENGQEYRYVMKAEVIRDGIVQSETKTVIVKAGADIREEFATLNDVKTASNR